jgi:hypothetical protein
MVESAETQKPQDTVAKGNAEPKKPQDTVAGGNAELQKPQDTVAEGNTDNKCPSSPSPEGFVAPHIEFEDYYEKLTKPQLEVLNVALVEKYDDADEKKEILLVQAEEKRQTAKDAFELAERKAETDLRLLNMQITNKKKKLHSEYRKSLRDTLPRNYSPLSDKDIENDDKVPKDQKAIKIVELKKKLAIEELDYLGTVQGILRNQSLAGKNWKVAEEQYEADKCIAKATHEKAKLDADVDWRIAISKALEETNTERTTVSKFAATRSQR